MSSLNNIRRLERIIKNKRFCLVWWYKPIYNSVVWRQANFEFEASLGCIVRPCSAFLPPTKEAKKITRADFLYLCLFIYWENVNVRTFSCA